jgi:hypothetical protein
MTNERFNSNGNNNKKSRSNSITNNSTTKTVKIKFTSSIRLVYFRYSRI